jgi:glutamine synthetase
VSYTPRNVLKRIMKLYHERGWKPIVAPEIEFYLVAKNDDPDYPLHPPKGRSGRSILGGQGYSIAGINEFDELIDDIYHFSEKQGLEIDTLIHEEGPAQLEINLRHGNPIELADQVFLFKRTIREAALKHGIYATFMAKPMQGQPGSAMHIHQSVVDVETGKNIFSNAGRLAVEGVLPLHRRHAEIRAERAGDAGALRELLPPPDARYVLPGQQCLGLRQPDDGLPRAGSDPQARRVENRLPSSDANPYLALAASLACGLLGIMKEIEPTAPTEDSPMKDRSNCRAACWKPWRCSKDEPAFEEMFGKEFIGLYAGVKRGEFETFMQVISPWEREFLLLNV